jgi:hypothetical protein
MTKLPYTYTVLRYLHDTSTGEFANIGIVLSSLDRRILGGTWIRGDGVVDERSATIAREYSGQRGFVRPNLSAAV